MLDVEMDLKLPLLADHSGVIRVGNTRVTLDTVIGAFNDGATVEEIIQQYPTLQLGDVYLVIAYYLRRKPDVDLYLAQRQNEALKVRRENEARFDPKGIRERLLARQGKSKL